MSKVKNCILIVDDDFINREVIKNVFDGRYYFDEAENGVEGLSLLNENKDKYCAVLLDVNMPVMGGIEMLKELYTHGITTQIPVFLVTSHEETEIAREAYELGVMDVINKPIVPFVISRRVQSVVELYQARETLRETVWSQEKKIKESLDRIDALHRGTIEALASAIEFRDTESGEHTNRIYIITKHILTYTDMGEGFSESDIENMAIGSIMHDIGKIAISDVILNKPGKLTAEEYEIMKQHTVKGGKLMEQLSATQSHEAYTYACDIARHHHERWDGNGYPDGLKGDEITVWSQVVSIADVYDALVSPRIYKKAYTPDKALEMIKNGECGVFNPKLLNAFISVEPEIRKWYEEPSGADKSVVYSDIYGDGGRSTGDIINVFLLMAAVESAYDMIISVNLTQNTYNMIDYARFLTHCAGNDGKFDDLIAYGATSIPESHRKLFIESFSRDSLLRAYSEGKKSVSLDHPQYGDDGVLHSVNTNVLLMREPRSGDVLEITLSRYLD